MLSVLDKILLNDNVVDEFYKHYCDGEFRRWLINLIPEVEDCKNLKQDNPWHIYNCLDHILHSVEEINKQSVNMDRDVRRMLAYTMFFHDMGKPECYIRRYSKLYGREIDSFFNHNKASVKIASRVLPSFNFDENRMKIINTLVDKHDIFMSLTLVDDGNHYHRVLTEDYVEDLVTELNNVGNGEEIINYLIMVGRSDNLSQNPKMTGNALKLLDVMQGMASNVNRI